MGLMESVIEIPAEHERNVFGQFDAYAKKIERTFHVTLIARGEHVKIMGEAALVEKAKKVLTQLVELSRRGNTIQEQNVDYTIALTMEDSEGSVLEIDKDIICHTLQGKPIKPKTINQKIRNCFHLAAESRIVRWAVTATGIWRSGTTYLRSSITTETTIIPSWSRRTLIPAWGWSVLPVSCRM